MDLIDRAALRKTWGMAAECRLCDRDVNDCRLHGFTTEQVCIGLDNALTIHAVPLEPLCEWLAKNARATFDDMWVVLNPEQWAYAVMKEAMKEGQHG